jgi:putative sterol carrier protein
MTLPEITQQFAQLAQRSPAAMDGKTVKFVFPEGVVHIDQNQQVTNEDKDADVSLHATLEDLAQIASGELNAMSAVMFGKLKIKGDMGVAMKLQSLFS